MGRQRVSEKLESSKASLVPRRRSSRRGDFPRDRVAAGQSVDRLDGSVLGLEGRPTPTETVGGGGEVTGRATSEWVGDVAEILSAGVLATLRDRAAGTSRERTRPSGAHSLLLHTVLRVRRLSIRQTSMSLQDPFFPSFLLVLIFLSLSLSQFRPLPAISGGGDGKRLVHRGHRHCSSGIRCP